MKKALPLVLLGVAALLVCLGVAALGANFLSNQNSSVDLTQWKVPADLVDTKKILLTFGQDNGSGVALEPLAGIADNGAIDDALQQGNWEAALATLAYNPDMNDANRAGTLLVLGQRYGAGKQTVKAAWCYQYAAMLATLSPTPSDPVRAQTLLQAAQGFADLNLSAPAKSALDQAFLIAQYSSNIPGEVRSRLDGQIAQLYARVGNNNLANQARQKASDAGGDEPPLDTRQVYRLTGPALTPNDDLKAKTQARVTAAKELMDQIALRPPKVDKDLPEKEVQALGDSLYEEDSARMAFYDDQDKAATTPDAQARVLREKSRWLALKLRVARRGFGLSLVSDWEGEAAKKIEQDLNDTLDQLYQLSEQTAPSSENAAEDDRRVEDVLRGDLVAARWGLYQTDENDLRSRLGEISTKLKDDQVEALRLDSFMRGQTAIYLLVPDDLYGQGEKALPK